MLFPQGTLNTYLNFKVKFSAAGNEWQFLKTRFRFIHSSSTKFYVFRKTIQFLKCLIFPAGQQDTDSQKLHCSKNSILLVHFQKHFNKDA